MSDSSAWKTYTAVCLSPSKLASQACTASHKFQNLYIVLFPPGKKKSLMCVEQWQPTARCGSVHTRSQASQSFDLPSASCVVTAVPLPAFPPDAFIFLPGFRSIKENHSSPQLLELLLWACHPAGVCLSSVHGMIPRRHRSAWWASCLQSVLPQHTRDIAFRTPQSQAETRDAQIP